jgi:flagellar biosynthesis/type III secretory pathway protein FliH
MAKRRDEVPEEEGLKERPRIMTQPLPRILDDIEESIRLANEAAKDAREAAEEARKAGEKAANEAARVAAAAIGKVEQMAKNAMQLAELLKLALTEAATTLDKRLSGKP